MIKKRVTFTVLFLVLVAVLLSTAGYALETNCTNSTDDDSDGFIDCADSDCDLQIGNITNGNLCHFGPEINCSDSFNNNGVNGTDCADQTCDGLFGDLFGHRCQFWTELNCTDGFNNDANGAIDCIDPDCSSNPACMECDEFTDEDGCGNKLSCYWDNPGGKGNCLVNCSSFGGKIGCDMNSDDCYWDGNCKSKLNVICNTLDVIDCPGFEPICYWDDGTFNPFTRLNGYCLGNCSRHNIKDDCRNDLECMYVEDGIGNVCSLFDCTIINNGPDCLTGPLSGRCDWQANACESNCTFYNTLVSPDTYTWCIKAGCMWYDTTCLDEVVHVNKNLTTTGIIKVGQNISFSVNITNAYTANLSSLMGYDTYMPATMMPVGPPDCTPKSGAPGNFTFNLTKCYGGSLGLGESLLINMNFTVKRKGLIENKFTVKNGSGILMGEDNQKFFAIAIPFFNNFSNPKTTDFNNVPDVEHVKNATIANARGLIRWMGPINANGADFDLNINIGNGFVAINTSAFNETLNSTALISMTVPSCPVSKITMAGGIFATRDEILANGIDCVASGLCNIISCVGTELNFTVAHFSGYAYGANANLTIYNNGPKNKNVNITFTAEYTNASLPISGATCTAYFPAGLGSYGMTEGAGSFYYLNKSFVDIGSYTYNVTCDKAGFTQLIANDTFEVTLLPYGNASIIKTTFVSPINYGDVAQFMINVTNRGNINITNINVYDHFDNVRLNFTGKSSPIASSYNNTIGFINWTNATQGTLLQPNQNFLIFVNFTAYDIGIAQNNVSANLSMQDHTFMAVNSFAPISIQDNTFPKLTINSPSNGAYYDNKTQMVTLTCTDKYKQTAWFYNGTANQTYTNPVNVKFGEGLNPLYAWCNDTSGNTNSTSISFTVDTIHPGVQFVYPTPAPGAIINYSSVTINVTADESNLINITLFGYNGSGVYLGQYNSLVSPGTWPIVLGDFTYILNATAYDLAGHSNSTDTRNFTIDTTSPVVNIYSPGGYQWYNTSIIYVNITAYDPHLDSFWWFNTTKNQTYTGAVNITLPDGAYNISAYANDTLGHFTSAILPFYVDTDFPVINLVSPGNGYTTNNQDVNFTYIPTDNFKGIALTCYLFVNDTFMGGNSYLNGSVINQSETLNEGKDQPWYIRCNDNALHYTYSEVRNITVDHTAPAWSNNKTGPASGGDYALGKNYQFNITWTDATTNVGIVNIEHNFTGTLKNYTVSTKNVNEYYYGYSDLPAGNYVWREYANDTLGNLNKTSQWTFSVERITSTCSLVFDKLSSQIYGAQINASCSCDNEEANAELYRDSIKVTSDENNKLVNLAAETYNYVCNVTETQNYTGDSASDSFTIDKAGLVGSLTSTTPWTITYPLQTTIGFTEGNNGDSDVSYVIFRNGTSIGTGELTDLPAGSYQYILNSTGGLNYSSNASIDMKTLNIQANTSTCSLSIAPLTATYGTAINASCSCTNPEAAARLYRNNTEVAIDTLVTLDAGDYAYVCNVTATHNYTADSDSATYTIDKADLAGSLTSSEGWTITYPLQTTIGLTEGNDGDSDVSYLIYRNGTSIGTGELTDLPVGTYQYILNSTGGLNYSSNNSMDMKTLNIQINTSSCSLSFNTDSPKPYQTLINASCSCDNPEASYELYRNNQMVTSTENNNLVMLIGGANVYACNVTATQNYTAASNTSTFTINPISPVLTKALNGIDDSTSVEYPNPINVSASTIGGTLFIYRNGEDVTDENGQDIVLGVDNYVYKFNVTGNQNFTDLAGELLFANVTQANSTCSLLITPAGSVTYPGEINASCSCTSPDQVAVLLRNDTIVTGENNQLVTLGVGTYLYNCTVPDTQNSTYASNTSSTTITINSTALDITLLPAAVNGYRTSTTAFGTGCPGQLLCNLTRNTIPVSNPDSGTLAAGIYNYTYFTLGNHNYTAASVSKILNITQGTAFLTLISETGWIATYGNFTNVSCVSNETEVIPQLYRNGTLVDAAGDYQQLAGGIYNYVCNSSNLFNFTAEANLTVMTIDKADLTGSLTSSEGWTFTYPLQTTIGFTEGNNGDSDVSYLIYRNGTSIGTGELTDLPVGSYQYILNSTGGQNYSYSASLDLQTLDIDANTSTCTLSFDLPSSQTYGTAITASCSCDNPEATALLYRDGANVDTEENGIPATLSAGAYDYVCNVSATQNYTADSDSLTYTIDKANLAGSLSSANGWTFTYPMQTTIGFSAVNVGDADVAYDIYRNGTSIGTGELTDLPVGSYQYILNSTGGLNYTSNASMDLQNLEIQINTSTCSLSFNLGTPQIYGAAINASCSCTSPEADAILYRDNLDVTLAENNQNVTLAKGDYLYNCTVASIQNYTGAQNYTTYSITKKSSSVATYLNNSESDITIEGETSIWLNGTLISGEGPIKLYNNGTLINEGLSPLSNLTYFGLPGSYNITAVYEETENYSSSFETFWVNVLPISCGDELTRSRTLVNDLTGCSGNGLVINTPDVVLDCDGHSIGGDYLGGGHGVFVTASNVTVKNCVIYGFNGAADMAGIMFENSEHGKSIDNTLYDNRFGIKVNDGSGLSFDNIISGNVILNSSFTGISINYAENSSIIGNEVYDLSWGYGIEISSSSNNPTIMNNFVNNSYFNAFYMANIENAVITGNTFSNTQQGSWGSGIYINGGLSANITRNTIFGNNEYGIYLDDGTGKLIWNNNIYNNTNEEIYSANAINLSYNGQGNYWGRGSCPTFIKGVDSNSADVIDMFSYNETDGWDINGDPFICGPQCADTVTGAATLTNNLDCTITALIIGANDTTVDCAGYTLTSLSGGFYGVQNSGFSNVTVKNCIIDGFNYGIYFDGSIGRIISGTITENTITSSNNDDILLNYADSVDITHNDLPAASMNGMNIQYSYDTLIESNYVNSNGQYGIYLLNNNITQITLNNITDNTYEGIYLDGSDNLDTSIWHNNIYHNNYDGYNWLAQIYSGIIPLEISKNNSGNYWGRDTCPLFVVYGTATDSNDHNVRDNFAYNETNGWDTYVAPPFTCGSQCGDIVTGSAKLTEDLNCDINALIIGANDTTVDCAGFTISANEYYYGYSYYDGITNTGFSNVTIKNCVFSACSRGIYFDGSTDKIISGTIINNTITSSDAYGIFLNSAYNVDITYNKISSTVTNDGVYIEYSNNTLIQGNSITLSGSYGIYAIGTNYTQITLNNITDNTYQGIYLDDGAGAATYEHVSIWRNNIYENNYGDYGYYYPYYSDWLAQIHVLIDPLQMEISYNGSGNYWGHDSCPTFVRYDPIHGFIDSNDPSIRDSFAYNETDGWLKYGAPPDCNMPPYDIAINDINGMGDGSYFIDQSPVVSYTAYDDEQDMFRCDAYVDGTPRGFNATERGVLTYIKINGTLLPEGLHNVSIYCNDMGMPTPRQNIGDTWTFTVDLTDPYATIYPLFRNNGTHTFVSSIVDNQYVYGYADDSMLLGNWNLDVYDTSDSFSQNIGTDTNPIDGQIGNWDTTTQCGIGCESEPYKLVLTVQDSAGNINQTNLSNVVIDNLVPYIGYSFRTTDFQTNRTGGNISEKVLTYSTDIYETYLNRVSANILEDWGYYNPSWYYGFMNGYRLIYSEVLPCSQEQGPGCAHPESGTYNAKWNVKNAYMLSGSPVSVYKKFDIAGFVPGGNSSALAVPGDFSQDRLSYDSGNPCILDGSNSPSNCNGDWRWHIVYNVTIQPDGSMIGELMGLVRDDQCFAGCIPNASMIDSGVSKFIPKVDYYDGYNYGSGYSGSQNATGPITLYDAGDVNNVDLTGYNLDSYDDPYGPFSYYGAFFAQDQAGNENYDLGSGFYIDSTPPTVDLITITNPDNFFSPFDNSLGLVIDVSDDATNEPDFTVTADLSDLGLPDCSLPHIASSYGANCDLSGANFTQYPDHKIVIIHVWDEQNNMNNFAINVSTTDIFLHNMGSMAGQSMGQGPCMIFGPDMTNFTEQLNFADIPFVIHGLGNFSCLSDGRIDNTTMQDAMKISFASVDISTQEKANQLHNLPQNMFIQIAPPRSHEVSRIYINSSYFAALNTTAEIKFFNLPFSSMPDIFDDGGLLAGSSIIWENTGHFDITLPGSGGSCDTNVVCSNYSGPTPNSCYAHAGYGCYVSFGPPPPFICSQNSTDKCNAYLNGPSCSANSNCTWTPGSGTSIQVPKGTLTFNVGGFSGYNITDDVAPTITFVSPVDTEVTKSTPLTINITLNGTKTEISYVEVLLNGSVLGFYNETGARNISCNDISDPAEVLSCSLTLLLDDGDYNLTVDAWDYGGAAAPGNEASSSIIFVVDSVPPAIKFVYPTTLNGAIVKSLDVNLTFSDANLDYAIVSLYDASGNYLGSSGEQNSSPYTNLDVNPGPDANYLFNATAYDLAGHSNSTETRMFTLDTVPPAIDFVPAHGSWHNSSIVLVNITVDELHPDSVWFFNGTANQTYENPVTIKLADGTYYITVYANDSAGNLGTSSTNTISVDTNPPFVTLISPANGYASNLASQDFTFNVTDNLATFLTCSLYVNGILKADDYIPNGATVVLEANLSDNNNQPWFISCLESDMYQVGLSETRNITVDSTAPALTIISPVSQYYNSASILVNINAVDAIGNLDSVWFFNGTANLSYSPDSYNFIYGPNTIYAWANDTAGNVNTTSVSFTVDDIPPAYNIDIDATPSPVDSGANLTVWANWTEDYPANATLYVEGTPEWTIVSPGPLTNFTWIADPIYAEQNVSLNIVYCDLAGNCDTTSTKKVLVKDLTPPVVNLVSPANDSSTSVSTVVFRANGTDTRSLVNCSLFIDDEYNQTDLAPMNGGITVFDAVELTDGLHNWSVECYDGSGNMGESVYYYLTIDATPPVYSGIDASPANGTASYSALRQYNFTVDWTDNLSDIANVWITLDGTTSSSVTNALDNYKYTVVGLSAGWHNYTWYANDTAGNLNDSMDIQYYYINKAATSCSLVLNPSGPIAYGATVTPNCTCTSDATPIISTNVTGVVVNGQARVFAARDYNFTCAAVETQNYLSATNSTTFRVNKANPTLAMTETHGWTVTYGTNANVACTPSTSQVTSSTKLYRNGQQLAGLTDTSSLGVNIYTYVCNNTATQNYTSQTNTSNFTVTRAASAVNLLLGGTDGNITVNLGQVVTITGQKNAGEGQIKLYSNKVLINTGLSTLTNTTSFNVEKDYNVTVLYPASQNYSTSFETHYIKARDVVAPVVTSLTPQNNKFTNVALTTFTFNVTDQTGIKNCSLYVDSVLKNTATGISSGATVPITGTLTSGSHTWQIKCYDNSSAKNLGLSDSRNIYLDQLEPTTTPAGASQGSTYYTNINLTLGASDTGGAGVHYTQYNLTGAWQNYTAVVQVNTSGAKIFHYRSVDNAGNIEATKTLTFTINKVPPTNSISSPAINANVSGTSVNFLVMSDGNCVAFYIDNNSITTVSAPVLYQYTWDTTSYSEGTHSLKTVAWNGACGVGNSNTSTRNVYVDHTSPTSTIMAPVDNFLTKGAITVNGTASDTRVGIQKVEVYNGADWATATGTTSWTYTFTPAASENINIRTRATDTLGNVEVPGAGRTVRYDTTVPTISSISITPDPAASGEALTIDLQASDLNGIAKVNASMNGTNINLTHVSGNAYRGIIPDGPTVEDTYTLTVIAMDMAGNIVTNTNYNTFTVNNSLPIFDVDLPTGSIIKNGTIVNILVFNFNETYYNTSSHPALIPFDGNETIELRGPDDAFVLYVWANTSAGIGSSATYEYTIDNIAPTFTISSVTTPTNSVLQRVGGTFNGANYITINGGLASLGFGTYWKDVSLVDGTNTITINATDLAGNSFVNTTIIILDTTAPTTTSSLSGTAGLNGWYASDVQVTLTSADTIKFCNTTGATCSQTSTYTVPFTISKENTTTVRYHAQDAAGNIESNNTIIIKIDKTKPSVKAVTVSDTLPGMNTLVTIKANISDANLDTKQIQIDGVDCAIAPTGLLNQYKCDYFPSLQKTYTVTILSKDFAGNQNNSETVQFTAGIMDNQVLLATGSEIKNVTYPDADSLITFATSGSADVNISINKFDTAPVNVSTTGFSNGINFYEVTNTSPLGNVSWMILRLYYTDAEIAGLDESSLNMYWYNQSSSAWIKMLAGVPSWVHAVGVDMPNNNVWANVSHFSIYSLSGSATTTTTTTTLRSTTSPGGAGGGGGSQPTTTQVSLSDTPSAVVMRGYDKVIIDFAGASHEIVAKFISKDSAQFTFDGKIYTLALGQEQAFDLDNNGKTDLIITATDISVGQVTLSFLNAEAVRVVQPAGEPTVTPTYIPTTTMPPQATTTTLPVKKPSAMPLAIKILILAVIIGIVLLVAGIIMKINKRPKVHHAHHEPHKHPEHHAAHHEPHKHPEHHAHHEAPKHHPHHESHAHHKK